MSLRWLCWGAAEDGIMVMGKEEEE